MTDWRRSFGERRGLMKIFGFAGWSGSGKTTLISRVIPVLTARGLRVSTVKRAHHKFDIDHPGKDSYEHRRAGATEVMIVSAKRWALMHEFTDGTEPDLFELTPHMGPADLVLVEGFKWGGHPKIEVYRASVGKPPLQKEDSLIVGVASDTPLTDLTVPNFAVEDADGIADFVQEQARPL